MSIDMVLHCPRCGMQHIDTPEPERGWTNPPHRSHLCAACEYIWRPADIDTNGVLHTQTHSKVDTPSLPVVVLLRRGPQRGELRPLIPFEQRMVSSVSAYMVGRERFAVYEFPPGSGRYLLVWGHGDYNVVNGLWTLVRNADGTAYHAHNPKLKAQLVGYVEDQMEYICAFSGADSEGIPHYRELLDAFVREMARYEALETVPHAHSPLPESERAARVAAVDDTSPDAEPVPCSTSQLHPPKPDGGT